MIKCHLTRIALCATQRLALCVALTCLILANQSSQDQDQIRANYQSTSTNNQEIIKVGNTKTQNYNFHQNSYLPTQLTQVVLNVPKLKKTLRKSRPPTEEEFLIKRKILDVYDEVKREITSALSEGEHEQHQQQEQREQQESTPQWLLHLDHLGRIIQALNPKYVATERVRRVAFADATDSDNGGANELPPLPEEFTAVAPNSLVKVELNANEPLSNQLDALGEKLRELIHSDEKFIELLTISIDEQLSAEQLALKHLLLCLNEPTTCNAEHPLLTLPRPSSEDNDSQQEQQQQQQQQQQQVAAVLEPTVQQISESIANTPIYYDEQHQQDVAASNAHTATPVAPIAADPVDRNDQQAPVYDEPAMRPADRQVYAQPALEYEQRQPDYEHHPASPYLSLPIEPPARRIERFIQRYPQTSAISRPPTNFGPVSGGGGGRIKPVLTNSRLNDYRNRFTPTRQPAFAFHRPPVLANQQQQQQRQQQQRQPQMQPQLYNQYQDQQWQLKQSVQRPYMRY